MIGVWHGWFHFIYWQSRAVNHVRKESENYKMINSCPHWDLRLLVRYAIQLRNSSDLTLDINSVFLRHCFSIKPARVISLSGVQLLGFIHLSNVKIAILDIVFGSFPVLYLCIFIENTNNWMFQINNQNPRRKVYKLIAKPHKFTWQKWIKSMGCNPIWRTHWRCDVSVGKHYR